MGLQTETGNKRGRQAARFGHAESEMLCGYSHGRHLQAVWSVGEGPCYAQRCRTPGYAGSGCGSGSGQFA